MTQLGPRSVCLVILSSWTVTQGILLKYEVGDSTSVWVLPIINNVRCIVFDPCYDNNMGSFRTF